MILLLQQLIGGLFVNYKNLIDTHTHTDSSFDGQHAIMYMCEYAEKNNVRAIAFTDHCEVDAIDKANTRKNVAQAYFETIKARSVFFGRLTICTGLELGQPAYFPFEADKIVSKFDYDFILASVHNLRNKKDFYFLNYDEEDIDDLLDKYFEEILLTIRWGNFDSLAHLTYPLRYIVGDARKKVNNKRFEPAVDDILKELIKKGKALELNTSGLRQKIGTTLPDEDIMKKYKSLGGELVTIGSDAHSAFDVGAGIEEGLVLLKECGFDRVSLYQNRTPILIPIE